MGVYDSNLNTIVAGQVLPPWDSLAPFYSEGRLGLSSFWGLTMGAANLVSFPSMFFQGTFDLNLPGRHFWQLGDRPQQFRTPDPGYVMPIHLQHGFISVQPLPDYRSSISHKGDCVLGGTSLRYHYPVKITESASDYSWGYDFIQLDSFYNRVEFVPNIGYFSSGLTQGFVADNILGMSTFNMNGTPNYHGLVIQNDSPVRVSMCLMAASILGTIVDAAFRNWS